MYKAENDTKELINTVEITTAEANTCVASEKILLPAGTYIVEEEDAIKAGYTLTVTVTANGEEYTVNSEKVENPSVKVTLQGNGDAEVTVNFANCYEEIPSSLVFLERLSCKSEIRTEKIKSVILQVICVAALALVAELIRCDYGMQGILFIAVFYVCRNHRIYQVLLFLLAYMGATGNQPPLCTLLACLLILLYNGKRGKLKLKYFFYVFYPAHILVLYLIQIGLGKYLL